MADFFRDKAKILSEDTEEYDISGDRLGNKFFDEKQWFVKKPAQDRSARNTSCMRW